MLESLRLIVQEVNTARNLDQVLDIIVTRVKQAIEVDVCSVYLTDFQNQKYILMATDGLNPESAGKVRMGFDEGLVGLVGQREEPLNLDNATENPRYLYFPETGEERYPSFLGVPIMHHRKVLGILIVQRHTPEKFDEDAEALLITVAAQLAGAIAHAEASGGINGLTADRIQQRGPVEGQPGAPGIAVGVAVLVYPSADLNAIPDRKIDDIENEEKIFLAAVEAVRSDIKNILERMGQVLPAEDCALFDAYLLMLGSDSLVGSTLTRIREGNWASGALRETINEYIRVFDEMKDLYLRERVDDVRDLGRRILMYLQKETPGKFKFPPNTVLVGDSISASQLAEVPTDCLSAVVSKSGSVTSHVAILARAMNLPAVMGADDLPAGQIDGKEIIVDGYRGQVYICPSQTVRNEYTRLEREEAELSADLKALHDLPAVTLDGVQVPLLVNAGLIADLALLENNNTQGIGLYRTEFPFMIRDRFPSEEEQRRIYREVLQTFAPKPVTIRTLDIGGDKELSYFPIAEDNPFLGWRGIRITLDHPEIFLVQMRAMLRANAGLENMKILFPMVSSVIEVDEALQLLRRAHHELIGADESVSMPKVGVMIEVPSAVYQADRIAQRVDFLSIGTNDLAQYLLAVDRNNYRVANLYDSLHPAVIRALMQIVAGAHKYKKPVYVCGEMAGDPVSALLLLGIGVDGLSMAGASIPRVKWVVRSFTQTQARQLLNQALELEDGFAIRSLLNAALEEVGLGGLVRAGK